MAIEAERLIINLTADFRKFERDMRAANGIAQKEFRAIERRGEQMASRLDGATSAIFRGLAAPLAGITAALGVQEVLGYADAWKRAGNALTSANVPAQQQSAVLGRLFDQAQKYSVGLNTQVELFGSVKRAAASLTTDQEKLFQFTEAVAASLAADGKSAGEASGALLQLGQALRSPVIQAEEFNSLIDGAPALLETAAKGIGRFNGDLGKLIRAAKDGELGTREFFEGILAGAESLKSRVGASAQTVEQSTIRIQNAFQRYVGTQDASLGATNRLVGAMNLLADNFDDTADSALQVAGVITSALLGRAIGGILLKVPGAISILTTFFTLLRTGGLTAAAAAGPIGALFAAAGAAAYLLSTQQTKAEKAALEHAAALQKLDEALAFATTDKARQEIRKLAEEQKAAALVALDYARAQLEAAKSRQADIREQMTSGGAATSRGLLGAGVQARTDVQTAQSDFDVQQSLLNELETRIKTASEPISDVGDAARKAASELADLGSETKKSKKLASAPIATAERFRGATEGRDGDVLSQFFKSANVNIDPKMTAWCAAFVNAALATNGLPGTGSLSARSFLNYGEKTNDPQRGDIVVLKRGNDQRQGHVGFFEGYDEKGGVRVLGGNQSDGVNTKSFAANQVLGFRKIPGAERSSVEDTLSAELERRKDITAAMQGQRDAYGELVAGATEFIAASNLEAATLGLTAEQAAKLRYEQDLLNQASQAGLEITPQLRDQISQLATGMASAEAAASSLHESQALTIDQMDAFRDGARDVLGGFISDLREGKSASEALGDALANIADRLLQSGLDGIIDGIFGKQGTAGGGLLAGVGKLFGFASGGYTGAGGKNEPAGIVHRGEYVMSKAAVERIGVGRLEQLHRGFADGGFVGGPSLRAPDPASLVRRPIARTQPVSIAVDVTGAAGDTQIREMVAQGVRAGITQYDRQLDRTIGQKVAVRNFRG